eukprot:1150749-Pelagomonas_calceolata.AAC.2
MVRNKQSIRLHGQKWTYQAKLLGAFFQGEAIKTLERSRDELALSLRNDINAALQKKANVADTSARIAEASALDGYTCVNVCASGAFAVREPRDVEVQMKGKADTSDMERRALKTDTDASLKMQMAEVLALMTSKANEAEVRVRASLRPVKGPRPALKTSHEQSMAALQSEVARLATGLEEVGVLPFKHQSQSFWAAQTPSHLLGLRAASGTFMKYAGCEKRKRSSPKGCGPACLLRPQAIITPKERLYQDKAHQTDLCCRLRRLWAVKSKAKAALSSKAGAGDTAVALAAKADLSLLDAQLREKVRTAEGEGLHS